MKKITVLGAGYMGSAVTFPLTERGYEVNLWGTWLDDEIIDICKKGGKHPKLKKQLDKKVYLYEADELDEALDSVDIIFSGITSEGFPDVLEKACNHLVPSFSLFALTKGFAEYEGEVMLTSSAARKILSKRFSRKQYQWCSIGGPVKAVELANHIPSVSVYGTRSSLASGSAKDFQTDYYSIVTTDDVTGVEVCSALKNIFATGMGICDGIYLPENEGMYHNFSSWMYTQSITEMERIVSLAKGKKETVFGFAGTGDLYVTAQSGRNRRLGELIGKGMQAEKAYNKMLSQGEVGEGYNALRLVFRWLKRIIGDTQIIKSRLPLLVCLYDIFFNLKDPKDTLAELFSRLGDH